MSKRKTVSQGRPASTPHQKPTARPADRGRRKFVFAGAGALAAAAVGAGGYKAGWFSSAPTTGAPPVTPPVTPAVASAGLKPLTLTADLPNAIKACDEITRHYAHALDNPYALIHCVRSFGKGFTRADGSAAVDHLCRNFAVEREVNGKRYVHFQRDAEYHENSFLKTFLEAGVPLDQPVVAGGNRYTLRDAAESAKALFRFDVGDFNRYEKNYSTEHLPWTLIAFSIIVPAAQPTWANAYGETVNLLEVVDRTAGDFEHRCEVMEKVQPKDEFIDDAARKAFGDYFPCLGGHALYSYVSLVKHGFRGQKLKERVAEMLDLAAYRMRKEPEAIDREYSMAAAAPFPPELTREMARFGATQAVFTEMSRLRQQIKLLGHLLESVNFARLHRLYTFTPEQTRNIQAGEQKLYEYLVRLRALDLGPIYRWRNKQVNDTVIALAHAGRAMKLMTPQNPDGENMRA
jgi:hypothetical protein